MKLKFNFILIDFSRFVKRVEKMLIFGDIRVRLNLTIGSATLPLSPRRGEAKGEGSMSKNLMRLYQFGVDPAFGKAVDFLRSLTAI